jgi:hypothetical protein
MGGFDHVAVEIFIGIYSASDGSDADGLSFDTEFIEDFGNESMNDTVGTAGTVMEYFIG